MKVWPQTQTVRSLVKHPMGRGFYISGYANWPDDTFTRRRMRDGSVADWYVGSRFPGRGALMVEATVDHAEWLVSELTFLGSGALTADATVVGP